MAGYDKPIGDGVAWIKESKRGKYLSWTITFPTSTGAPITVTGVAFKNDKKEKETHPDYKFLVNKQEPAKAREYKPI